MNFSAMLWLADCVKPKRYASGSGTIGLPCNGGPHLSRGLLRVIRPTDMLIYLVVAWVVLLIVSSRLAAAIFFLAAFMVLIYFVHSLKH